MTRAQLAGAGLGRGAISHRLAKERLRRLWPGVYLVGAVPPPLALETAALLTCGPGALLSYSTAARRWQLPAPEDSRIHVTLRGRRIRPRPGIRVHRVAELASSDVRRRSGLPVTSPVRTVIDLAGDLSLAELERLVAEAEVRRLLTRRQLSAGLDRVGPIRGTRDLRRLLASGGGPALTRSEAERRMLALIRTARLPEPRTNVRVSGYVVDMLWREQRLVLEVDGFAFHSTREAFERDRARDAQLQAAGYRVMRVTWLQLVGEPDAVVARLAMALSAGGA